jgi:protein-disulfide isomerase
MNRKKVFIASSIAMLAIFAIATILYTSERDRRYGRVVDLQDLVRPHSPTLGSADAKVHIVEFLDPACEVCRAFYPQVKKIMAANPGRIRLSVRHLALHKGADHAVKALEAARGQGMYWEALEALLTRQNEWVRNHVAQPELVWRTLEGLGLDIERAKIDMHSPEIERRIAQDLKDSRALDVKATPTFFVNGRGLPKFGIDELQALVKQALGQGYEAGR